MPCDPKPSEGLKEPADCRCYGAVLRTYKGMSDEPESVAFDAALRVYRFHHPEDAQDKAALTVERWLYAEKHH